MLGTAILLLIISAFFAPLVTGLCDDEPKTSRDTLAKQAINSKYTRAKIAMGKKLLVK
jgi:hypothetical protein